MFYVISKVLFFLTNPSTWIFGLLLLAVFTKRKQLKRMSLILSISLFYFFSNEFILEKINASWEYEIGYYSSIENQHFEAAVVLGGYSSYAPAAHQVNFGDAGDRFFTGIKVLEAGIADKLILSGGHGRLFATGSTEAEYSKTYLLELGIDEQRILIDTASRNTYQNAVETERILTSENIRQPILLITSCDHMVRSKKCFDKVGVDVVPFCVDALADKNRQDYTLDYFLLPNAETFFLWHRVIHEWLGLLAYKMMGYI